MGKQKHTNTNTGAAILFVLFCLLFFVLYFRFVQLQTTGIADGQVLAVEAEKKYTKKRAIEAQRGSIFDRNGEEIAENIPSYTVVAVLDESMTTDRDQPRHVVDPEMTAKKLAPLLKMGVEEVERILKKDAKQVEFGPKGRNISQQLKLEIEALKLPGIGFLRDTKRYYPNGTFASHTIGYATKDEKKDKIIGMMGLEKSLNNYLNEKDGYVTYKGDLEGLKLPNTKESIVPPENGHDVYLTIDQKIQTYLEDAMNLVVKEYQPEKIIAIVADPKTGEILAMGSRPSFDPNKRNITNYLNDAISYPYEPGSTMKIFTLAAAINEGVYNGNELFQSGSYKVPGNKPINDHNKVGWGKISFNEGVQRSSNVAFSILAKEKLGEDRLLQYLHRFRFNQPTGIDLPGEVAGNIVYRYPIEKLTTAFGQGTTITPIQQIQAATAIANNGKMMKPYIIDRIVDSDTGEVVVKNKPEVVDEPITKETAAQVLDILETVVSSEKGTGRPYRIEGYRVAGKTGTAQIPSPSGGYLTGYRNYIFSFIGMVPKENPQLLMYVAVKQPKISFTETGAAPVSMIFNSVIKNSLHYLNIRPSREETTKKVKKSDGIILGDYAGVSLEDAVRQLQSQGLNPVVIGQGTRVEAQHPLPSEGVVLGKRILLKTDGEATMPDITGWSLRDAMELANLLNLQPSFKGHGYTIEQSIKPGTKVKEGDYLIAEFAVAREFETRIEEKKTSHSIEEDDDRPLD